VRARPGIAIILMGKVHLEEGIISSGRQRKKILGGDLTARFKGEKSREDTQKEEGFQGVDLREKAIA